jgi:hypothetical protein
MDELNSVADVAVFLEEIADINRQFADDVLSNRKDASDVRFTLWAGQSADGRKRKDAIGKDAKPFEGASDGRIRMADLVVKVKKAVLMAAAARSVINVTGTESSDWAKAQKVKTLVQWVLRNQLGWKFRRQMKILLDYMLADSPALGVMGVYWHEPTELEPASVSMEEAVQSALEQMMQAGMQPTELDGQRLQAMFTDPEQVRESAVLVAGLVPELTVAQAKEALRAWGKGEAYLFEAEYKGMGYPVLKALRMYEDVWFSGNVEELQAAPAVFVREWLTRPELYGRVQSMGYDEGWGKELVGDDDTAAGAAAGTVPKEGGGYVGCRCSGLA